MKEGNRLHVSIISNSFFPSQMWHLSFWNVNIKEDLRLRSLKATHFGEEEERSRRLTCGNDSSFLQIPSIVSSSSLPYSPRHWGQGFSRAGGRWSGWQINREEGWLAFSSFAFRILSDWILLRWFSGFRITLLQPSPATQYLLETVWNKRR